MEQTDYVSIPWDAKHDRPCIEQYKKISGYTRSVIANFCYVSDKITKDYRFTLKKKLLAKTSHVGPTKVHQT